MIDTPTRPPSSPSADPADPLRVLSTLLKERALAREREIAIRLGERLGELGDHIFSNYSLQGILQHIALFVTRDIGCQRSVLFLDDRGEGLLTARALDGFDQERQRDQILALRLPCEGPIAARVAGGPIVVTSERADAEPPEMRELVRVLGLEQGAIAPIAGPGGRLRGLLVGGGRKGARPFVDLDEREGRFLLFRRLAEQASWAIGNCITHWELAVERNLLEARVSERTAELQRAYTQIQEDLDHAREVQERILSVPSDTPGVKLEVLYRPLEVVGGDVYDVEVLADGRMLVFVADATGHGVSAALTTMFIKSEYDQAKRADGPGRILSALNDAITGHYGRAEMRFTAVCLELDLSRGRVRWASAAHPPPVLIRDGVARELSVVGSFIGVVGGIEFDEGAAELNPGDALYVVTDGALEVWSAERGRFDEQQAYAVLAHGAAIAERSPAAELYAELCKFCAREKLDDDVTVLGLRIAAARP